MFKRRGKYTSTTITRILLTGLIISIASIGPISAQMRQEPSRDQPLFHYVVVKHDVMDPDQPDLAAQSLVVLMDEDAFTEDNLRKLFVLLSKRFPTPEWMDVFVYTNVEQLETPEQRDAPPPSDSKSTPMDCTHRIGFLARHKGNEFLRYTLGSGLCELKTVMLKGDRRAA